MEQKNQNFAKAFGIFAGIVLLLTFFSKSIYNYQLPVVSVATPKSGKLSFTVEGSAEVSYSHMESVYSDVDGWVKEILVRSGEEVEKGQCLMKLELAGTEELCEIVAEKSGIITSIGVKKGMYVSSMQNIILYGIAEKSEEWTVTVFVTEDQLAYVDGESVVTVQITDLNKKFNGNVQSVVSYADRNKTGYQAEILITSDNQELAGKKAKVTIEKESEQYDTIIPAAALRKDSLGYYVLVLQEEDSVLGDGYAAYRMSVDLLNSDEEYCAVRGLPTDETVITASTSAISGGSRVRYEGNGAE
jgi:multidrug efflux pump subunit AcrA (membrane-fusion protein)